MNSKTLKDNSLKKPVIPTELEKSLKQLEQIDLYALDKQKPPVKNAVKNNNT